MTKYPMTNQHPSLGISSFPNLSRPPPFAKLTPTSHPSLPRVTRMSSTPLFVGLDVGGTTMKAGVVADDGRPLTDPVSLSTDAPRGQEHGLAVMAETIRRAVAAAGLTPDRVAAVGV